MSDDTPTRLKGFLKSIGVYVLAGVGFLTGLINMVQLVRGNAGLATIVSLICVGFVLYASLFYIRFSKIKPRPTPGFVEQKPSSNYAYSQRARRLAGISIFIATILTVAGLIGWQYQRNLPTGKITILVANFQGREQDFGVTDIIFKQLKNLEKRYGDINVKYINENISIKDGGSEYARKIGSSQQASIVIWGGYYTTEEKVLVDIHFEILNKPESLPLIKEEETLKLEVMGLKTFDVQEQLSNEMTYLVLLTVGLTRYEAEDYDGAITRFTDALEQHDVPKDMIDPAVLFFYRGSAYSSKNDFNKAIADYSEAIASRPDLIAAYNNRGNAYLNINDDDSAINDFNKIIDLQPDLALAYANRGTAYSYKNDIKRALSDFDKAISLDPDDIVTYVNRGSTYAIIKEMDLAIADFDRAIKRKPDLFEAYNNRGFIYTEKGDLKHALADFERALQLKPGAPEIYINRGRAYFKSGDVEHAFADYNNALRLKPNFVLALLNRGTAYSSRRDYDRAIADYSEVIKVNPRMALAYHYRGTTYSEKGEYDLALTDYAQAIDLDRNNAEIYVNRGITYARKGKFDQAIADFNQAIILAPNLAEAFLNRGLAYQDIGRQDRAIKDLRKVFELTDNPEIIGIARNRLLKMNIR
jgi:tetratricopeptide (TPR) repeat protein